MSLLEKLNKIQHSLVAPKGQYNSFGKYKYRSTEDILEGLKPLIKEQKVAVTIQDEIVVIGDRYYVKATVKLYDCESEQVIENVAYAREEENKKGMDSSQVTGATSSYARKYALNGMFAIDDTKDADTDAFSEKTTKGNSPQKTSYNQSNASKPVSKTAPKTTPNSTPRKDSKTDVKPKIDPKLKSEMVELIKDKAGENQAKVVEVLNSVIGSANYQKVESNEQIEKIIELVGKI